MALSHTLSLSGVYLLKTKVGSEMFPLLIKGSGLTFGWKANAKAALIRDVNRKQMEETCNQRVSL